MPKLLGKCGAALAVVLSVLGAASSAQADKPFPYIYVLDAYASGSIDVVDTATKLVVAKIQTSNATIRGVIAPDGRTIYAIDILNNLYAIDASRNIVTSKISAGPGSSSGPLGMVITPDGSALYFANAGGAVIHFATATNVFVKSIPLPASPQTGGGMAVSPDGKEVFVALPSSNSVAVIDTATDQITDSIPVGSSPAELAITPDGAKLYVVNATTVSVVSTATKSVIKTVPVAAFGSFGSGLRAVTVSSDGSRVYVNEAPSAVNANTNTIAVIATSTDSVVDRIYSATGLLATSPDGTHVYLSDTDRVVVIDSSTDRPVGAIPGINYTYGIFSGPFRSQSTLLVNVAGNGTVTSKPAGVSCGTACSLTVGTGSTVTLTATASSGSVFAGWGGACAGMADCTILLGDDSTVSAMFSPTPMTSNTLSVSVGGTGKGTVVSTPSGIHCGTACAASYASGSTITLAASPEPGSVFSGWSGGGCSGTGICTIALDANTAVTASFAPVLIPDTLSILVNGSGGKVVANSAAIDCPAAYYYQPAVCAVPFQAGATVTLMPLGNGYVFTGWSGGGCSGTGPCTVTLGGDTAVTANFSTSPNAAAVYVQVQGNGSGTVSSNPAGLYCNLTVCSGGAFPPGTTVTLTASPDAGSTFTGWGGSTCSGTGPCTLALTSYTSLTATFTSNSPNVRLSTVTGGSGSITSFPAGIACNTSCTNSFANGTAFTLTATPDSGSVFIGWTGGCFGTAPCSVYLNQNKTIGAIFAPLSFSDKLSVSLAGAGSGGITSNPLAISCGMTCTAALTDNSPIALTAVAATGSVFTGWSNPQCGSSTACSFNVRADTSLTATFQPASLLTVLVGGATPGSVSSTAPGISCPTTCSALFATGSQVTLSPSVFFPGVTFLGWSGGGCSGTGNCTVTLNADTTVSANFTILNHTISVSRNGSGSGTVTSTGANPNISCGTVCAISASAVTYIQLTAAADVNSTFTGWSGGGCSGTSTCLILANQDATVTANFTLTSNLPPPPNVNLTVSYTGNGLGQITISPENITCAICGPITVPSGALVTLTATPAPGSTFTGWSGACSGITPCNLVPTADTTVTANFAPTTPPSLYSLSILRSGAGSGTTGLSPSNSSCATSGCIFPTAAGTQVTLLAAAAPGSIFTGWSGGGCSGIFSCTVVMPSSNLGVDADFQLAATVSVAKAGTGAGTVVAAAGTIKNMFSGTTVAGPGITCGVSCAASFQQGLPVVLTASAAQGSVFSGWSGGGCSGTGNCTVTPTGDVTVTAMFTVIPTTAMLSVTRILAGNGTVNSAPSGIACFPTCNASFDVGAKVTLTATADAGATFIGWSGGGCTGNKSCTVTIAADTTVVAGFTPNVSTGITLVSAILPSSRSVQVGATATLFGTMINAGPGTATFCGIAPATNMPGSFYFQTTDPATNGLTGTANTLVNIPQGAAQSFLLAFTPSAAFNPTNVAFSFSCSNAKAADSFEGVNTLMLSASTAPIPDIVSIAGTLTSDGQLHLAGAADTGAFVVAIANVGATGQITATADTGGANLPVSISICQTNQATGACLQPPTTTVPATVGNNTTASFGIFVKAMGAIPFMPAVNRVFVRFLDGTGTVRGSTSVAVRTQ